MAIRYVKASGLALLLVLVSCLACPAPPAESAVRSPTPLVDGWRFVKGDPEGVGDALSYAKLKPWMLAVAAGEEHPEGDPGAGVSYTRPDFDDSHWRELDLPHDWGVEGPFDQALPGENAKLPYAGVAWYRKRFDVPASDEDGRYISTSTGRCRTPTYGSTASTSAVGRMGMRRGAWT